MKPDALKKYTALRQSLLEEKKSLEARLAQINQVLEIESSVAVRAAAPPRSSGRRVRNALSLRAAVLQVTKDKPLAKPEILAAIKKLGYKFTAKDPMNSLNTVLYTGRTFKNAGGKFSPAQG